MVQVKLLYVLNCQHFDLFQLLALGIPIAELRLCLQLKATMAMLLPESNQKSHRLAGIFIQGYMQITPTQ